MRASERHPNETGEEFDHRVRMAAFTPEQRAIVEGPPAPWEVPNRLFGSYLTQEGDAT